jgi:hypothetical protein
MFPYGISPSSAILWAPMTPARPTSMTFDARRFIPKRNPARKTVAARSTQTGQSGRVGLPRPFHPIHAMRPSR